MSSFFSLFSTKHAEAEKSNFFSTNYREATKKIVSFNEPSNILYTKKKKIKKKEKEDKLYNNASLEKKERKRKSKIRKVGSSSIIVELYKKREVIS